MFDKWYRFFINDEMDIKERLFRIILVVGTTAVGFAIIEGLTLVNAANLMIVYGIMFITFLVALIATFIYHRVEFSSTLLGIAIIVIALPFIFFKGGGVNSGAGLWMSLGIFYVFLMFRGKKLAVFLALTLTIDIGCYIAAYMYPELVIELATDFEKSFDSIFAVVIVSLTVGCILKFQLKVFEQERKINELQKEELKAVSSSKEAFFASMSHEIRTPIHSIIGLNELIMRENPSDEILEYARNIRDSSKLLLGMVNDVLDLSQLENHKMELMEQEYLPKEMFLDLVHMIQVQMNEKGLKFDVKIDKKLPSVLYGDERRIRQILINLLSNAVKYTKEGSVSLSCSFEMKDKETAMIKIAVADTGIGIRKEELEFLFDAFRRADVEQNHKIEGTGLGLSIVKYLVDIMGGMITVDSIYTQGSLFTVVIPQKVCNMTPIGELVIVPKEKNHGVYYRKSFEAPEARILIVDDDDLNLIIANKLLQETKMTIDTASSVEECLRKTKSHYYNVILMDYMMPGKSGDEVLREIRKQEYGLCRDTPIILLTANIMGEKENVYIQMGFDGFLEKPINAGKLEEEVLRYLPNELIEYRREDTVGSQETSFVSQILTRKKKKVCILSDSVCDLPVRLLEAYDIGIVDLYIKTEFGRFKDEKEIDVNNISKYLSDKKSSAYSLSAPVEEYEHIFAQMLMEAEDVIYISLASRMGRCYENAKIAAKGFSHVHVIDSGFISGGQALLVLHAARMAKQGFSADVIKKEMEYTKNKIAASMLLPSVDIFYQRGFTDHVTAKICNLFNFRPVLGVRDSKIHIYGVRLGKLETVWRHYIRYHLRNVKAINDEIIFITHAGLSVRQQEIILEEVNQLVKFKQVILTQASVSNVCNAGLKSIGIAFYRR